MLDIMEEEDMQNFNIHSHTIRCHHAVGTDEEYVQAAIKCGLHFLGFSDHVPFRNRIPDHDRMTYDEMNEYLDSIASLKEKYKNQITILSGFECEYFPEFDDYYKELLAKVDYLILGQHYPSQCGTDFCESATDDELVTYSDLVCQGIKSGYFSYVAHPSYFMLARDSWSPACTMAIERICKTAKEHNMPIEINLKGISYGKHNFIDGTSFFYPNKNSLAIVEKYNNTCVYGLDCHDPKYYAEMNNYINEFKTEYPQFNQNMVEDIHLLLRKK